MKGKRIITVLCMLLVAFASYAGGSSENDDSVIIWHSNSGIIGTAFDEIIENFNETIGEENGIYVEAIYQGAANDVLTKVKAAAMANTSTPHTQPANQRWPGFAWLVVPINTWGGLFTTRCHAEHRCVHAQAALGLTLGRCTTCGKQGAEGWKGSL